MQQVQQVQKSHEEQIILPISSVVRNVNGDRYTVEELLGKGGSGAVYLVRDRRDKQNLFALKELIDPDKVSRELFAFEAEVLMRLDHEALPHVYRVFENEKLKRVYILMDYIEGKDLEVLRKEQPDNRFPLHLVLALLTPIVGAINYLHHCEPPIVHRDIKPANIVVPAKGDEAILVDFGIAKEYTDDGTTTVIRHGSPGYAALEQYGGGTNTRTDVYGLGATLYTLLTGVVPVDAVTRVSGGQGVDPLKPAHELVPELPPGVSNVISRALNIGRDSRFATINEFWAELNAQSKENSVSTQKTNETTEDIVLSTQRIVRVKKDIAPMTLGEQRQIAHTQKRRTTAVIFVGILLALVLAGTGIATFISHIPHTTVSRSIAAPILVRTLPTATPTILDQAPYPTLATAYEGSMHDFMNNKSVNSSLVRVQQSKGTIHGFCNCLGLAGPFDGTVGVDGSITFSVKMVGRETSMLFEGHIKTGGDLAGQFYIVNANGQHTDEYGIWSFK